MPVLRQPEGPEVATVPVVSWRDVRRNSLYDLPDLLAIEPLTRFWTGAAILGPPALALFIRF